MTETLAAVRLPAWVDPASVHRACFGSQPESFWLDAGPDATEGWSFVGTGAREHRGSTVRDVVLAGRREGTDWPAGPFRGGWVGWLDYEDGAERAGAPVRREDIAGSRWIRAHEWIAFDHASRTAWAVAAGTRAGELARDAASSPPPPPTAPAPVRPAAARHAPEEYARLIQRCRDAIREGDAYQLCLTTRFEVAGEHDAADVHARLRRALPAHHGACLRIGGAALVSASPERFLQVADGVVATSPIKGTRPRGADPAADRALARELRCSEKERAENVMIVDLMRNDLSRVCEPATVGVDRLLEVESYSAVHQLVSTVSGRLEPGTRAGDLLDAAFPAGSMTGTPKLSAMTILHRLEGGSRGVFAGCFGWIGLDGSLDLAMVIRSIVIHAAGAYVGAGGGITWRSEPAAEVEEVGVKARGPLSALGAELPPGWLSGPVG